MGGINTANGTWRLPLPALAVFEAAGRRLNFSIAARELGTTQPAVSHHIAWLEGELDCALFHRLHRGVSLTPEGRILFEAVSLSRDAIERAQAEIKALSGRTLLSIGTDYGFAGDWLMPRLARLSASVAEVEVRIVVSQANVDPAAEAVDFTIMLGSGDWPGCVSTKLFPETVHAVASPHFLAMHGPIATAEDLTRLRLLHLESRDCCVWLDWSGWFAAQHIALGLRQGDFFFNTYPLVQQAAIAGQGVALGWRPLVDQAIESGLLVPVLDQPVRTGMGYHLVEAANRRSPPAFARFREWLLAECARAGAATIPASSHPPGMAAPDMLQLLDDTSALLRTLEDPRVDAFLAHWPKAAASCRPVTSSTLPVLRWLPRPQNPESGPRQTLVGRLHEIQTRLAWSQTYAAEDFGAAFLDRYGWTELIGLRGPVPSETLACGFLLLGPDVEYPDHRHMAEEIYIVLSGTASWRRGAAPWRQQPPGAIMHHPPNLPHAMRTSQEPLLALYLWHGADLTQKPVIGRDFKSAEENPPFRSLS